MAASASVSLDAEATMPDAERDLPRHLAPRPAPTVASAADNPRPSAVLAVPGFVVDTTRLLAVLGVVLATIALVLAIVALV